MAAVNKFRLLSFGKISFDRKILRSRICFMNSMLKTKRCWWQIFVFAQEAYLSVTAFVFSMLAFGRIDTDGSTMWYMLWSYFAAIIGLLVSGITLIVCGKTKSGLIALAFAVSAFILLFLLAALFAAMKRRG
jgi:hypothetical protein